MQSKGSPSCTLGCSWSRCIRPWMRQRPRPMKLDETHKNKKQQTVDAPPCRQHGWHGRQKNGDRPDRVGVPPFFKGGGLLQGRASLKGSLQCGAAPPPRRRRGGGGFLKEGGGFFLKGGGLLLSSLSLYFFLCPSPPVQEHGMLCGGRRCALPRAPHPLFLIHLLRILPPRPAPLPPPPLLLLLPPEAPPLS